MSAVPRALSFSLGYAIVYIALYYLDLSPIRFYPETGALRFFVAPDDRGQIIVWYGWVGMATLAGLSAAYAIPKSVAARIPADLLWVTGVVLVVAVLMYERRWFFG
jgi:hypothetical protein